jgi:hypothetical protein
MVECSPHIRIFASSPADVADERKELKKVVEELARRRTWLSASTEARGSSVFLTGSSFGSGRTSADGSSAERGLTV